MCISGVILSVFEHPWTETFWEDIKGRHHGKLDLVVVLSRRHPIILVLLNYHGFVATFGALFCESFLLSELMFALCYSETL